jgi:hypothetical protein
MGPWNVHSIQDGGKHLRSSHQLGIAVLNEANAHDEAQWKGSAGGEKRTNGLASSFCHREP